MRIADANGKAFGEIDSLPGCSQVAVSHSVFVDPDFRGQGIGEEFHQERLRLMSRNLGYDYALCTVDSANSAQIKILEHNGWSRLDGFVSSKTGHYVALYGRVLK